jgi:putative FmdB family regulatory protein
MPTYEYECTKCGHTFEAFQSISAKPLSRCPECKGSVKRLINGGLGVIFKGSGFYSTDNKRGSTLSGGNGSGSKDREKAPEKPSETASTEAKPAATEKKAAGS